jgi:hypothetical protein
MKMASIRKIKGKEGITYNVMIRKKDIEISRTFKGEEDANLYIFYKERLIDNMANFEVPLSQRVTLDQLFDLKRKEAAKLDRRTLNDIDLVQKRIKSCLPEKKFYHEYTYEDWIECAKKLYNIASFRGSKDNIIKIAPKTLKRLFGVLSSVISCAIDKGIELDNHPLKVIQTFISPIISSSTKGVAK